MTNPSRRGWLEKNKEKQSGQALVFGLSVMAIGLASLFFLFNSGQLFEEKNKLVNTADAAAYAGGVMQARALNFDAYSNRALVANEVLVAQMVSISSWGAYVKNASQQVPVNFPGCAANVYAAAAYAAFAFGLYEASCYAFAQAGDSVEEVNSGIQQALEGLLWAIELNKALIKGAQEIVHSPIKGLQLARNQVMADVVNKNYEGDGTVSIEPNGEWPGTVFGLNDGWQGFAKQYKDGDRVRMAGVARQAANTDAFTRSRQWREKALLPELCGWGFERNYVDRAGGTELIGLDEWKAADTFSFRHYYTRYRSWGRRQCKNNEHSLGWGKTDARRNDIGTNDYAPSLGNAREKNPNSYNNAVNSTRQWTDYSGLPSYYDLSNLSTTAKPVLGLTVRLIRDANQLKTGDGRSAIRAVNDGNQLNPNRFRTSLRGNRMVAMSAVEVFFERPQARADGFAELGSLFNPFWQVRLTQPSQAELTAQAVLQ